MRLWVLSYQEKCPAGNISSDFFVQFLERANVSYFSQLSHNTFFFQSKDDKNWKYWSDQAEKYLEPLFYYSILELKNSDCKPVGALNVRDAGLKPAYVKRKVHRAA